MLSGEFSKVYVYLNTRQRYLSTWSLNPGLFNQESMLVCGCIEYEISSNKDCRLFCIFHSVIIQVLFLFIGMHWCCHKTMLFTILPWEINTCGLINVTQYYINTQCKFLQQYLADICVVSGVCAPQVNVWHSQDHTILFPGRATKAKEQKEHSWGSLALG